MTWNLEHGVPKMMFLFLPGNHKFLRCNFSILFHSFWCIFPYIFPRYFGRKPGKIIEKTMRFPDLCYPLVIKHGESMRIPRLVKPEVKRPSVMPVKAGPDRSDFHKTNLQDFHFKH